MAEKTAIQWTEDTWNPLGGCTPISPGCANCYAMKMAARLEAMGQVKYAGTTRKTGNGTVVWTGKINTDDKALTKPLRTKKPTTYFVNSMSDLFHEDVPDDFIDEVFAVMALTKQHTFQVLTKRAKRMAEYMCYKQREAAIADTAKITYSDDYDVPRCFKWPLPNAWLGVSVENQEHLNRIDYLSRIPAAIRFVSFEPLLGPIVADNFNGIDWCIIGGESGPGARLCDIEWIRDIVRQCRDADVKVFVKQLGSKPVRNVAEIVNEADGKVHYRRPYSDPCVEEAMHTPGYFVRKGVDGLDIRDPKGGKMSEWPEDLRIREFPTRGNHAR